MALLPVEEAIFRIGQAMTPTGTETLPLRDVSGRVLASPLTALRTHPPFDGSAMDGYAVRAADVASVPATLRVVGESAAGGSCDAHVQTGEAVRIFTGAPIPKGADAVVIQEDTSRSRDTVTVHQGSHAGKHIRLTGIDFREGSQVLAAGTILGPAQLALTAAANHPTVTVYRKPVVAFFATGSELVEPGQTLEAGQIVSSNSYGLAALVRSLGGLPVDLGIAMDTAESLVEKADATTHADLIVTLGGASVGDYDLVQQVLEKQGLEVGFWKIAMRPGKPLMFGAFRGTPFVGLPGNPVSALVCAELFVRAALDALTGRPCRHPDTVMLPSSTALPANSNRQDYLRARLEAEPNTGPTVHVFPQQDSSMLSTLAMSNALIVRPPAAAPVAKGEHVPTLLLQY